MPESWLHSEQGRSIQEMYLKTSKHSNQDGKIKTNLKPPRKTLKQKGNLLNN